MSVGAQHSHQTFNLARVFDAGMDGACRRVHGEFGGAQLDGGSGHVDGGLGRVVRRDHGDQLVLARLDGFKGDAEVYGRHQLIGAVLFAAHVGAVDLGLGEEGEFKFHGGALLVVVDGWGTRCVRE